MGTWEACHERCVLQRVCMWLENQQVRIPDVFGFLFFACVACSWVASALDVNMNADVWVMARDWFVGSVFVWRWRELKGGDWLAPLLLFLALAARAVGEQVHFLWALLHIADAWSRMWCRERSVCSELSCERWSTEKDGLIFSFYSPFSFLYLSAAGGEAKFMRRIANFLLRGCDTF